MKREYKNFGILGLLVAYILFYKLFLFPNFKDLSEMINTSFFVILLAISIKLLGFRKDKPSYDSKNVMKVVVFYVVLAFFVMYGIGFAVGFLSNAYSRTAFKIFDNIFIPIALIIIVELFRYVVIWANKDKKILLYLYTIAITVFELSMSVSKLPIGNAEAIFRLSATILLPVIIKNCVMSYLCYHVGYKIPMFYRLIMDTYMFIIPVIPDYGEYLQSMIFISLPLLIYINAFSLIDEREKRVDHIFVKSGFSIFDIPITIVIVTLAILISGLFPHYMIGIGSNSMSPKINKGDAVILRKYNKQNLKKGDIIAFQKEGVIVVHRINEVTTSDGKKAYVTKGDANNAIDSGIVTDNQVKGIVKLKIPIIAYPTVWVTEYFKG